MKVSAIIYIGALKLTIWFFSADAILRQPAPHTTLAMYIRAMRFQRLRTSRIEIKSELKRQIRVIVKSGVCGSAAGSALSFSSRQLTATTI